MPDTISCIQQQ